MVALPGGGAATTNPSGAKEAPVGGRLAHFSGAWRHAPRWHQKVIQRGMGWRFSSHPPSPKNLPQSRSTEPALDSKLRELQRKKVIEPSKGIPGFISKVKLVPKSNGDVRLILDLSRLNKYISPLSYKIPKLTDLRAILPKGAWLAKLDLKDAYHHIPICESGIVG